MSMVAIGVGLGAAGMIAGGIQAASGAKKAKKAEAQMQEAIKNAPKYAGSSDFDQFYQQTRALANTSAQNTALYKMQQQQADRAMAAGLQSANLGGNVGQGYAAKLAQQNIDASARNLASAEQLREQRIGRYGQAASQKMGEDRYKFQINQVNPWEAQYNLYSAKAGAGRAQQAAGFQNIAGGANMAFSAGATAYGKKGGSSTVGTTTYEPSVGNPNFAWPSSLDFGYKKGKYT